MIKHPHSTCNQNDLVPPLCVMQTWYSLVPQQKDVDDRSVRAAGNLYRLQPVKQVPSFVILANDVFDTEQSRPVTYY